MIEANPTIVELDMNKLEEILRRLEANELDADDYETIKAVIGAYVYLFNAVGNKETTIRRLRQMLFGVKTEKTSAVVGRGNEAEAPASLGNGVPTASAQEGGANASLATNAGAEAPSDSQASGHGRNGAEAYMGAEKIEVPHPSLQPGDPCPKGRARRSMTRRSGA